jgi:TolB-like protein/thioredoxin-like negative regulator of GroEL
MDDCPGESANLHPAVHAQAAGPRRHVFISYASTDTALAQKLCAALEAGGIPCWIAPRDVMAGTLYAEAIVGAIDDSSILVLVLSAGAVASAHVGRELERAASKRHPIIALRTDTAPLTRAFEYFLNQSQWIEVGNGGMDAAIAQLVAAVEGHLSPRFAVPFTNSFEQRASPRSMTPRLIWIISGAVVVLGLIAAYFLIDNAWLRGHSASQRSTGHAVAIADRSIAVLPFTDMSEKKDQEYFADGMAEEIIDLLAKVPGLKVIGRTSSFQFKNKSADLRAIGSQLGVAYVLEGSVRKSGDRLRVTAELINTQDGAHLLSQTYDRDFIDVLKMQDEIAASLVRVLQVEVNDEVIVSRPGLRNTQAYTLYLRGLHAKDQFDQQGFELAVGYFQQALDLDPSFAAAAGGLANAYFLRGQFGFMPPTAAFAKARSAAELALKLSPQLAATHALLGNIDIAYDWDWAAADREVKSALADAPNDAYVLFIAAVQAQITGRLDDALQLINASLAQDPLNPSSYYVLSYIQIRRGRLVEAQTAIRRTLEISPTFANARYCLGLVLLLRGQPEAAFAEVMKEGDEGTRLAGSAIVSFARGDKADSDAALARMLKDHANRSFEIARIYAFRGEPDEAFKWLDLAYSQKDPYLYSIKGEPILQNLEKDPRYNAFLKKMNLRE